METTKRPDEFNAAKEFGQIENEIASLKQRLLGGTKIEPPPKSEQEMAKEQLTITAQETASIISELDYNSAVLQKPSNSIKDIMQIMDDICQKLDLIPHSEQIVIRNTSQIMNKLNQSFEEYQNTHQLSETEKNLLADFFSSQLKAITPRVKSK